MRLRFLRRTGCDPLDLLRDGDGGTFNGLQMSAGGGLREMPGLGLPFFQDRGRGWTSSRAVNSRNVQESSGGVDASFVGWGNFRADVNAEYQKELHRALTAARPAGAPLRLLRGGEEFTRHYVPWEGANGPGGAPAEMGRETSPKRVQWVGSPEPSSTAAPPDAAEIDPLRPQRRLVAARRQPAVAAPGIWGHAGGGAEPGPGRRLRPRSERSSVGNGRGAAISVHGPTAVTLCRPVRAAFAPTPACMVSCAGCRTAQTA
jgi:hypothetical protein